MSHNESFWFKVRHSIALRIIAPFLLITLFVAASGTFVVTTLMTRTAEERYANQLLDAGRVAAERLINLEESRLESLRLLAATREVAENVAEGETAVLSEFVRPIIINFQLDAVKILDLNGDELFGWERPADLLTEEETIPPVGRNFAHLEDVQLVLSGFSDEFGNRRIIVQETENGNMAMFTIGPIFWEGEPVGAVMVGSYLDAIVADLSQNAVARVTLYDPAGEVLATNLVAANSPLSVAEERLRQAETLASIRESAEQYRLVTSRAEEEVLFNSATVMGQEYKLAYGDWRLRGQSFGLYSVAFPFNYIESPLVTGRNTFVLLFSLAFLGILVIGLGVTRSITKPLSQLVEVATAVGEGQLDRRSEIERRDEIGQLAASFDLMTARLENRNRALLQQTSELEAILNSITDGVILLNNRHQIVTANKAAQLLFADLSHDFLTNGSLRELPAGHNGRTTVALTELQTTRHQIGNRVLTSLSTEVTNPDGIAYGTVIVLRDVTQEVEGEQLKGAFITSISHELRTPLTVIKVYADLLLKAGNDQLTERQQQFAQNIQKSSQQLEQHINQLLHISEIQARTVRLVRQRIALPDLVLEAVEKWRKRFESKGVDLSLSLPDEPAWVWADAAHLGWAIENLLSNAHNYTQSGGRVAVNLARQGTEVVLTVQDRGIGIASADQKRLFERFFRAENSVNYETRGVGLGLYIVRSVVELHNGHIMVSSELGQGSAFTVTLPLETA